MPAGAGAPARQGLADPSPAAGSQRVPWRPPRRASLKESLQIMTQAKASCKGILSDRDSGPGRVHGDPVRRRILVLLADGERAAGEVSTVIQEEFGISQPGVSQHLRVLRDNGFTTVRAEGARRLYSVDPARCGRSTCGWSATAGS